MGFAQESKSETRHPKPMRSTKHETRNTVVHNQALGFWNSDWFRVSIFVLRISGQSPVLCITVLLASLAGCGPPASPTMFPVEGQVRFEGKPLTRGTVVLYPDGGRGNSTKHEPRGNIEPDGTYKIVTHPHEGAPAGWYKVAVIATEPSDSKNPYSLPRSSIPERFKDPDKSGLTLEVQSQPRAGAYDFDLK
jgi:hypothetical protein